MEKTLLSMNETKTYHIYLYGQVLFKDLNEEEFKNAILGTGFEVIKVAKADKFIEDAGEARKLVD